MTPRPESAMVLAAGLGTRMRHLTEDRPKPLVPVAGRALIDRVIDALKDAGISNIVVNAHYKAEMLRTHLGARTDLTIQISDETAQLLDTGGGVKHALPLLTGEPILTYNSDFIWQGAGVLAKLIDTWDPARMDALMLLSHLDKTTGFEHPGDFFLDDDARIRRRGKAAKAPFAWMGVQLIKRSAYDATPDEPFSNNLIWDRLIKKGRLFGHVHDGIGMHVGSPEGLAEAERVIATS